MMDKNGKFLITGGSGFLGNALIERLWNDGYRNLRVVSRNEGNLVKLKEKYPEIEIVTGDIASNFVAGKVTKDVDGVFHLAAMKHIGLAEDNVMECIHSNILGTFNILKNSTDCDFVIGISTDKAAQVSGVYGATKMLMEKLFKEFESFNSPKYRIVRYGNIIYSTGSVLCKWKDKMQKGETINLTDPNSTRFYWTVEQAIDLIMECLEKATDSTPYIPKMKSIRLGDLVAAMLKKYGNTKVNIIGLQPGENLHETMDGKVFSNEVERYSQEEISKMI